MGRLERTSSQEQSQLIICISADIHELSEIPIQDPSDVSYDYEDGAEDWGEGGTEKVQSKGFGTNLIVSQATPFTINKEIDCYVNINKEKDDNDADGGAQFSMPVSTLAYHSDRCGIDSAGCCFSVRGCCVRGGTPVFG